MKEKIWTKKWKSTCSEYRKEAKHINIATELQEPKMKEQTP